LTKQYLIRIEPLGKEVTGSGGETVLDALRRQFYGRDGQPSFPGCRRGGCAYCKAELIAGEVHHNQVYSRAALSDEERENGMILACQSRPRSDLAIRLLKGVRN
jgi:ferredoxin